MESAYVDRFRVMVMGDSHVRRLLERTKNDDEMDVNFGLKDAELAFRHSGGATVARLRQRMPDWLENFQPHILIVMAGGNDLTEQDVMLQDTADQLQELARVAKEDYSVLKVIICAQLDRTSYPDLLPPYPRKLYLFNQYLKETLRPIPRVVYWRHAKLVKIEGKLFDGVHLTDEGYKHMYKSVRSLLIRVIKGFRYAN